MDAARERGKKARNDPREKWGVQRIAFHAELGIDPDGKVDSHWRVSSRKQVRWRPHIFTFSVPINCTHSLDQLSQMGKAAWNKCIPTVRKIK